MSNASPILSDVTSICSNSHESSIKISDPILTKPIKVSRETISSTWRISKLIFNNGRDYSIPPPSPSTSNQHNQMKSSIVFWVFCILVIACVLECLYMVIGFIPAKLYSSIIGRRSSESQRILIELSILIVCASTCLCLQHFLSNRLYLLIRTKLTATLHTLYFDNNAFYRLARLICNPDQRISVEVQRTSKLMSTICERAIITPLIVSYYSWLCVRVLGWWALGCVYLFFAVGAVAQRLVFPFLVNATMALDSAEGDFRFAHAQLRINSEQVCLSRGSEKIQSEIQQSFHSVVLQSRKVILAEIPLCFISNLFYDGGTLLNFFLIIQFLLFNNQFIAAADAEVGATINATSFGTLYLINKLTGILDLATNFSQLGAHCSRLIELINIVEQNELMIHDRYTTHRRSSNAGIAPKIVFSSLDIVSPDGRSLLRNFDCEIVPGEHTFITGPNGSGKTSIVRVLMNLWNATRGRAVIEGDASIACIPREPLMLHGSLLEQLGLSLDDPRSEDKAMELLSSCALINIIGRIGGLRSPLTPTQWTDLLSTGEIQKLAHLKHLINPPTFLIIDDSSSSLDNLTECSLYRLLWAKGITTITIGQRLGTFLGENVCTIVLLNGNGTHTIKNIRKDGPLSELFLRSLDAL